MGLASILIIAVGLSMDAFAVSISSGLNADRIRLGYALKIASFFGVFQAVMPIIGFAAGLSVRDFMAGIDHWIAFALLAFIGAKMIYEALSGREDGRRSNGHSLATLLVLSVATSIDALAVGISFSLLDIGIIQPACIIGLATFLISLLGVLIGRKAGQHLGRTAEVLGGVILIGIGLKILLEHLS
jgi:putative Mn2+ efflux pump MntP